MSIIRYSTTRCSTKIKEHEMKNLKRTAFLLGAALCLLAACSDDSGDDLPGVNLNAPSPSALPALADGVTVVADETAALALFGKAADPLMEATERIGGEDHEDNVNWSVRGNSASRGVSSYAFDPIVYRNDKTVIPGASVTGYVKGSFKSYSKDDKAEDPSPGDYTEFMEDAKFEVDLLEGWTADDVEVKGRIASAVYVKMRMETVASDTDWGYDTAVSSDIDEKIMYALTITDLANHTGGRFILEITAKGKVTMDWWGEPDGFSGIDCTATLKVYDNDDAEVLAITLDADDIGNYLQLDA
jgi:hypothetical protein